MIIACTGASYSAKTTFAETLKKLYPDVVRQHEIEIDKKYEDAEIRTANGLSIDQIRQNPYLYFSWEKAIILKKIEQEKKDKKTISEIKISLEKNKKDIQYVKLKLFPQKDFFELSNIYSVLYGKVSIISDILRKILNKD